MISEIPFEKILNEALREGGEFADLYLEETYGTLIMGEEDRIEKVISGLDTGMGLRVLFDGRTIYGFTNQITEEDLLCVARKINRAVKEDRGGKVIDLTHRPQTTISSSQISNSLLGKEFFKGGENMRLNLLQPINRLKKIPIE